MAVSGPSQWATTLSTPCISSSIQRCALGRQQIAQHQHNCSVQQHCAQTAGDKCTKLLCHRSASGLAAEDERPVGGIGKQDAEDVVQHIAPAVGGSVAEQPAEQRIQHNIQQGGQYAENQVTEHFPVLFEKFYHGFVNKKQPRRRYPATGLQSHCV